MAELKDILVYLLGNFRGYHPTSNDRITMMVYLADWRHTLDYGSTISGVTWKFAHYGPFVSDIEATVKSDPETFKVKELKSAYGQPKMMFYLKREREQVNLTDKEKSTIDYVIKKTKKLSWSKFILLVFSTYPMMNADRSDELNLKDGADEYKEMIQSNKQIHLVLDLVADAKT